MSRSNGYVCANLALGSMTDYWKGDGEPTLFRVAQAEKRDVTAHLIDHE
jgi:hypothetical protein